MYNSNITIYHFTKNLNALISILKSGFYPHVCEEEMSIVLPNYKNKILGIPMVCFTEIPLQHSEKHRKEYGFYGIGLTKMWAVKKGISPISYVVKDTASWKLYNNIQKEVITTLANSSDKDTFEKVIKMFIEYSGYIKPYSSDIFNPSVKAFYEENEWRYTPPFANSPDSTNCNWLLTKDLSDQKKKNLNTRMKEEYTLKFNIKDVTEIILPNENDKEYFLEKLPQYISKIKIIPKQM